MCFRDRSVRVYSFTVIVGEGTVMNITKIAFKSDVAVEYKKPENIVPFTHGYAHYDYFTMALYDMGLL